MDSISQAALGAAVGLAVAGRTHGYKRAALWGAALGTLPDLDVVIPYDDAIEAMVFHRGESHAFFFQGLVSPLIGWAIARFHGTPAAWRRWAVAAFLVFATHALLDAFTIYGTQLALPFSNHAYQVGSIFIIDPAYTLPLLAGIWWARRRPWANTLGLVLSSAYLAWGVWAQSWVEKQVQISMAMQGISAKAKVLANPTPFQTLQWRVVVVERDYFYEGVVSVFDPPASQAPVELRLFERGAPWLGAAVEHPGVVHLQRFAQGMVAMRESQGRLELIDLRMGREGNYFFRFDLGPTEAALSDSPPRAVRLPRGF